MHIGVLTHNYPRFPGDFSGVFIEALCQEFARQEQQLTIWAPFDPAYQISDFRFPVLASAADAPKSKIKNQKSKIDLRLYRYAFTDEAHTLGYMRTMQSDLALRRNSYWLGPALMAAGIATITRQARQVRPDLLHAHWLLPNGLIGAVVSRLLGIPLVISVPGSDAQVANANPVFRTLARFAMRQAGLMTANSADLRDAVAALAPTVLNKFDLILYGADPAALKPDPTGVAELRAQWLANHPIAQSSHPVIILCVGRMVYKKGFDTLIRALAEPALRDQDLLAVMVGEGDQKAEWQALAHELGVYDRLRWVGNVPKDKISIYYNACDLLVNPSVRKPVDGLNVCVLDAMSCGKAVVGSTVAGNPLAIVDGETGFLTTEGDPAALATALAKLAANPALRQQMGAAARRRIETELGWPPLVQRYLAHFQRLQR
ncbi:MAG: glycosyltransferase family 4 protein [Caldilinea sp. CFX5]|nr:glycosyltransferase family 4 protein [Caldilinea sp. CFX5]